MMAEFQAQSTGLLQLRCGVCKVFLNREISKNVFKCNVALYYRSQSCAKANLYLYLRIRVINGYSEHVSKDFLTLLVSSVPYLSTLRHTYCI